MARRKKVPESYKGQIVIIPREVKRSTAYRACSLLGRALLFELSDQHNGANNGHLHLAYAYLRTQGFRSKSQIAKGKDELLALNLIVQTKQGGLPIRSGGESKFSGPSLYALPWLPISNFNDLDIQPRAYFTGGVENTCRDADQGATQSTEGGTKKTKCAACTAGRLRPAHQAAKTLNDPDNRSLRACF